MKKLKGVLAIIVLIFLSLLVLLIPGWLITSCSIRSFTNAEYENYTITNKESISNGKSHKYLIFCKSEDGEVRVFENEDSMLKGKHDSADVYADLEIGETYNFKVVGVRVPFLSWYENIIEYEKVSE